MNVPDETTKQHPYDNDQALTWHVSFPGAAFVSVRFDESSATEPKRDFLRFFKAAPAATTGSSGSSSGSSSIVESGGGKVWQPRAHGSRAEVPQYFPETASEDSRFGGERYSGRCVTHTIAMWFHFAHVEPGCHDCQPTQPCQRARHETSRPWAALVLLILRYPTWDLAPCKPLKPK